MYYCNGTWSYMSLLSFDNELNLKGLRRIRLGDMGMVRIGYGRHVIYIATLTCGRNLKAY
jgi:hypothetical protein